MTRSPFLRLGVADIHTIGVGLASWAGATHAGGHWGGASIFCGWFGTALDFDPLHVPLQTHGLLPRVLAATTWFEDLDTENPAPVS
jgi:hypothetical protein